MNVYRYCISIQPLRIPSQSISGVLVATPNNWSSPLNSSVFSIFSREGKLILSTEPPLVSVEKPGVDVVEDRIFAVVVELFVVEDVIEVRM